MSGVSNRLLICPEECKEEEEGGCDLANRFFGEASLPWMRLFSEEVFGIWEAIPLLIEYVLKLKIGFSFVELLLLSRVGL